MSQPPTPAPPPPPQQPAFERAASMEEAAKRVGGDKGKLVALLAEQERWNWYDVATLLLGSRQAVQEFIAESNKAYEKRVAEGEAAARAEGEAVRSGTATTQNQRPPPPPPAAAPPHR